MNLGFLGGRLTGFTYIDVDIETRTVLCIIIWGVVLGATVIPIEVVRGPIIPKLAFPFAAT